MTIYFLKDIISRKKKYLNNADIQTVHVPQYKNLSLEKIFDFVVSKPQVEYYLPDEPDLKKVPK